MEGDFTTSDGVCHCIGDFNPLPPCGGRLLPYTFIAVLKPFQSTPSVWREPLYSYCILSGQAYFNPLPPCGGRLMIFTPRFKSRRISIHSLRVEGDIQCTVSAYQLIVFQSTPSVWRETWDSSSELPIFYIFQSTPSVWRETCAP